MGALWRKQIMPFDMIEYGNREVNFTPAYLDDIASAFAGAAFDVVSFAAESPGGGFSGDPVLRRGVVRRVEVVSDGMEAVIEVDSEMDALLEADPDLPAAVRIIEQYKTSGGSEFPAVLAGVYATRAPMLTGLRPWTREPAA